MILEIELAWHQAPGWLSTLSLDDQARLIALHQLHIDPSLDRTDPAPVATGGSWWFA